MYVKVFSKILDSSIWVEDVNTRIVWFTLLASCDESGIAWFATLKNLANRVGISPDAVEKSVKILESPDKNSSDPEHEGRRIERRCGGWMVLNFIKYREIASKEDLKAKNRRGQKAWRERQNSNPTVIDSNPTVIAPSSASKQIVILSEAKEEAKEKESKPKKKVVHFVPPTSDEVATYKNEINSIVDPEIFIDAYTSKGWRVGKSPMKDWKACFRNWSRREKNESKPKSTINIDWSTAPKEVTF